MSIVARIISHFGSQAALARALGVTPATVNEWASELRPIPPIRALQIERFTGGEFKAIDINPKASLDGPGMQPEDSRPAA